MIELFHFLRPLLLLGLPVIFLLWWMVRQNEASHVRSDALIAPHLLDALTVNRNSRKGFRAADGVCLASLFAVIAAAGPTWSKQPSPWFSETAPLVIAVEVSDSMRSNDMLPTRLERARFKILDLVALRTGSRTALIAYAGSAHVVVPPTTDPQVLKTFLESLDPAIMPASGASAASVLPVAQALIGESAATGTLLFVNDGFGSGDVTPLKQFAEEPGMPALAALVVGTEEGGIAFMPDGSPVLSSSGARLDTAVDETMLRRISGAADVSIVRASAGDADIRQLSRTIESNLLLADDPDAAWRDQGWWFLWPCALLALLWFRRGWTMQW